MAIKIYTKTGDKGTTSLLGGQKVSKADLRIEAYGTLDELNAYIGLCHDLFSDTYPEPARVLRGIQNNLFVAGSLLACAPETAPKMQLPQLSAEAVELLEQEIDKMEAALPPLRQFILPGGHLLVSHIHIARCICRRAERNCVRLGQLSEVEPLIIRYLNRMSDYLFVLARFAGNSLGVAEIAWTPVK